MKKLLVVISLAGVVSLGVPSAFGATFTAKVQWAYYSDSSWRSVHYDFNEAVVAPDGTIGVSPTDVTGLPAEASTTFYWTPYADEADVQAALVDDACCLSVPHASETLAVIPTANVTVDGSDADWATVTPYIDDAVGDACSPAPGAGADIDLIQLAYSRNGSKLYALWTLAAPADSNLVYRLSLDKDLDGHAAGTGDYRIDVLWTGSAWAVVSQGGHSNDPCDADVLADGGVVSVVGRWIEASVDAAAFGLPDTVNVFACSVDSGAASYEGTVYDLASHHFHDARGYCVLNQVEPVAASPVEWWSLRVRFSGFENVAFGRQSPYAHLTRALVGAAGRRPEDLSPWIRADWITGHYKGEDYDSALLLTGGIDSNDSQWSWDYDCRDGVLVRDLDPNTTVLDLDIWVQDYGRKVSLYYRVNSDQRGEGWYQVVEPVVLPEAEPLGGFGATRPTIGVQTRSSYGEPVPVYCLLSDTLSERFYTIQPTEKERLVTVYSHIWSYSGIAWYALADDSDPNCVPVYRFWSGPLSSHLFTASERERDRLINDFPDIWTYEGVAFYAWPPGAEPPDTSPVYRFWSDDRKAHCYMIGEAEKTKLVQEYSDLWTYEGIAWYAYEGETTASVCNTCPTTVTCAATCRGRPTCYTTCVATCIGRATCFGATCSATWCNTPTCSSTCSGATCSGATCGSTCGATCGAFGQTCSWVTCSGPTCRLTSCAGMCPTQGYTCSGGTCSFCLRSGSSEANASPRQPPDQVVYSLQKDWLIMDWTCPAIDVDCPAVVPQVPVVSEEPREPSVSKRLTENPTNTDS